VEKPFQVESKTAEPSVQNTPPETEGAVTDPPVSSGAAVQVQTLAADEVGAQVGEKIQYKVKAEVEKKPEAKSQQPPPQRSKLPPQRSLPPLPPQQPPKAAQQKQSPRPPLGKPPLLFQPGRKKSPASPRGEKNPQSESRDPTADSSGSVPTGDSGNGGDSTISVADAVRSKSEAPTEEVVPPVVSVEENTGANDNEDTAVVVRKDDTLDEARGESASEEAPPVADETEVAVKESGIPVEEPQIAPTNSAKSSNLSLSDSCDSSISHTTSNPGSSTTTNSPATAAPQSPRPADKNDEDVINSGSPPSLPRRRLTVSTPVLDRVDILPETPVEVEVNQNDDADATEKETVVIADEDECEREEDADDKVQESIGVETELNVEKESDGVCEKEGEVGMQKNMSYLFLS